MPGPITNPATIALLPVPTKPRVDMLTTLAVDAAAWAVNKRESMAAERAIVDRRVRATAKKCLIGPETVQGPKMG